MYVIVRGTSRQGYEVCGISCQGYEVCGISRQGYVGGIYHLHLLVLL